MSRITKGPFTKDVRLTPGEGGLQNPDIQLLFECNSIVLSGRNSGRNKRRLPAKANWILQKADRPIVKIEKKPPGFWIRL